MLKHFFANVCTPHLLPDRIVYPRSITRARSPCKHILQRLFYILREVTQPVAGAVEESYAASTFFFVDLTTEMPFLTYSRKNLAC